MLTRSVTLFLLAAALCCMSRPGAAQVPVKLFTANDGQQDKGTAQLATAVQKRLAEMPKYKLWQGGPAGFPKDGVVIDIQGMDITAGGDDPIGSAVLLVCSAPAPHDPGYYAVRYRELIELRKGDTGVDDEAAGFLAEMDKRTPSATAKPEGKSAAPIKRQPGRKRKPKTSARAASTPTRQ